MLCYNAVMLITAFLICFLLAVVVFAIIVTSTLIGFVITRVPLVRSKVADTAGVLMAAGIADGQVFYDIGSGDGRVVFLAERLARVQATGFELTVWVHMWALLKRQMYKSSAQLKRMDFFKHSWAEADMVYCFLFPPLMPKVEQKFLSDCKQGAVLISRDFKLPGLVPIAVMDIGPVHTAYIYRK